MDYWTRFFCGVAICVAFWALGVWSSQYVLEWPAANPTEAGSGALDESDVEFDRPNRRDVMRDQCPIWLRRRTDVGSDPSYDPARGPLDERVSDH